MDAPESPSAFLLLFGFLGGMCALGVGVAVVVYFGGRAVARLRWRELAGVYPAGGRPPEGVVVRGCGANVGANAYPGTLVVTFAREGIHVAPASWPQFEDPSYPPVLLPWSGVKSATRKETRFARNGIIRFRDGENRTLTLLVPGPGGTEPFAASGWSDSAES